MVADSLSMEMVALPQRTHFQLLPSVSVVVVVVVVAASVLVA